MELTQMRDFLEEEALSQQIKVNELKQYILVQNYSRQVIADIEKADSITRVAYDLFKHEQEALNKLRICRKKSDDQMDDLNNLIVDPNFKKWQIKKIKEKEEVIGDLDPVELENYVIKEYGKRIMECAKERFDISFTDIARYEAGRISGVDAEEFLREVLGEQVVNFEQESELKIAEQVNSVIFAQ